MSKKSIKTSHGGRDKRCFYKKATFAAGCFWGVEEDFLKLKGVVETAVGYMGGHLKNPTYEDVLSDRTGHAEVVQLLYDASVLSYEELLISFFNLHNPSTIPGSKYKYRSSIFYHSPKQKKAAEVLLEEIKLKNLYVYQVKTTIVNADVFYKAEEYHQRYYEKMGKS